MNKTVSIIIAVALVIGIAIVVVGGSSLNGGAVKEPVQNVEVKDGVQYISIDARGGYFPRVSNAKAGIPTKLIIKTRGTYDCSAALVIRAIDYQSILPQTGQTEIDIGVPKAGEPLQGVCGMGMYNFVVNFS